MPPVSREGIQFLALRGSSLPQSTSEKGIQFYSTYEGPAFLEESFQSEARLELAPYKFLDDLLPQEAGYRLRRISFHKKLVTGLMISFHKKLVTGSMISFQKKSGSTRPLDDLFPQEVGYRLDDLFPQEVGYRLDDLFPQEARYRLDDLLST